MTANGHHDYADPHAASDTAVVVTEIPIRFDTPPQGDPAADLHPESQSVYREAFAAELAHLPDIRDRLFTLADRAGYTTDVETAIGAITDAADEVIDAVEYDDPGALDN